MLPTHDVKAKMSAFISRHFKGQTVNDTDDIFAMGFVNSLFALQLVRFVEKEFDLAVENEDLDIDNFRTINAMAALVRRKAADGGQARG